MSRLVPVLLHCLTGKGEGSGEGCVAEMSREKAKERVKLFKKVFVEAVDDVPADLDSRLAKFELCTKCLMELAFLKFLGSNVKQCYSP